MKITKSKLRQIIKECILAEIGRGRQGMSVRSQHPPLIDPFREIPETIKSINLSAVGKQQQEEKEKVINLVRKLNRISIEQEDIRKYQNIMTKEFNELIKPIIHEAEQKYEKDKEEVIKLEGRLPPIKRGSQEYNHQETPNEESINIIHQQIDDIVKGFNKYLNNEYNPKTNFFRELKKLFYEDKVWTTTVPGKPVGKYEISIYEFPKEELTNPPTRWRFFLKTTKRGIS